MTPIFNGFAFIQGVGTACTVTVSGYAAVFMDSAPISHRAKLDEHVGTDGNFCALVHSQQYLELSLSFRPASSSVVPDDGAVILSKGSKVTLSGFKPVKLTYGTPPAATDILNTDWLLVGDTTITLNAADPAVVDLTIRNYLDKQAALLVTVPPTP